MNWGAHIKGVVIAAIVAVVAMFTLSFFVSSQLNIVESVVINKPAGEVFTYVRNPSNFSTWIGNINDVEVSEELPENKQGIEYMGHDGNLHRFVFLDSESAKGVKVKYYKNGDELADFEFTCKDKGEQTILEGVQLWNLGINPLKKITAKITSSSVEKQLQKDLLVVKRLMEEE